MSAKSKIDLTNQLNLLIPDNITQEISADDERQVIGDAIDSALNIVDGGLVIQSETGYSTPITPGSDYSFATKKYVDDAIGSIGTFFEQGGNSFGATAVLQTTDEQDLEIGAFGETRIRITSDGDTSIFDANGVESGNFSSTKTLRDDNGDVGISVKWAARELWANSVVRINWVLGILYNSSKKVIDWLNYLAYDIQENISLNINTRQGITSKYLLKGTVFNAYGDSFTVGQNASPSSNSYINLLVAQVGATVTNNAVSGRGVWQMASSANTLAVNSTSPLTALAGFNDYRRSGTNAKTDNKVFGCFMSAVVANYLKSYVDGQHFSITKSTNYNNNYAANTVGGRASGVYNTGAGLETLTYTFSETNVVVGVIGNSGDVETFGTLKVYIDSILVETISLNDLSDNISDGSNDNRRAPYVLFYPDLGPGSHTIVVEAQGDGYCPVDYFGHLNEPDDCKVVALSKIPYMNATGYAIAPANGSDAVFDQGSSIIESVYDVFNSLGYPIVLVDINAYYDILTGLDTDNIHPNNTGHAQIYEAFKAVLDIREASFDWNKRETYGTWGTEDIKFLDSSNGPILKDRTTGTYYRLYVDGGSLSAEPI